MNVDVRSIVRSLFKSSDEDPFSDWQDWDEYIKYILWSATETLVDHATLFHERGFQQLNFRSIEFIENLIERFDSEKITDVQVIKFLGEWIGILLAKEPAYILVLREVVSKTVGSESNVKRSSPFINLFTDEWFFEWAEARRLIQIEDRKSATVTDEKTHLGSRHTGVETAKQTDVRSQPKFARLKLKCSMTPKQIDVLRESLIREKYIDNSVDIETFSKMFDGSDNALSTPIQWLSKTVYLAYLFYELSEEQHLLYGNWQTHIGDRKQAFLSKSGTLERVGELCLVVILNPLQHNLAVG